MMGAAGSAEFPATGPDRVWWRSTTLTAWRALALGCLGWMFDVCDNFMLALTIPALITVFGLSKAEAGTIGSVLAAGLVLGGIVFGWIADRIGRVRTLMLCVSLYSALSGLTAFAPSATWVGVLRFAAGIGLTGIFAGLGPLTAELAPPDAGRAFFMGLAYNGGRLGGILAPFLIGALATTDANFMLGMATAIPAFFCAAAIILLIPETRGIALR